MYTFIYVYVLNSIEITQYLYIFLSLLLPFYPVLELFEEDIHLVGMEDISIGLMERIPDLRILPAQFFNSNQIIMRHKMISSIFFKSIIQNLPQVVDNYLEKIQWL